MSFFKKKGAELSDDVLALISQKKQLEIEVRNLTQNLEFEKRRQDMAIEEVAHKHRLELQKKEKEYEIKHEEIISLLRVEQDQRVKQAEITAEKKVADLGAKHSRDLVAVEQKLSADYYDRLKTALEDLHTKGNITTQFLQEITMQLLKGKSGARKALKEVSEEPKE